MKPTVGTAKPINTAAAADTARELITPHLRGPWDPPVENPRIDYSVHLWINCFD
jgi:hypothetical protein